MTVRFAFVGFRHAHILDMYRRCRVHREIEVVASCEEDEATYESLQRAGEVQLTHRRFAQVLEEDRCDVVAVGDCYGLRAERILAALAAGKHVISDKPLCISLAELDRIESAAAARRRVVGCMLDMRDLPVYLGLRQLIRAGELGDIHAISFEGQHPLLYGKRPAWYFEPGMHGGVLNDIAVHAVDFIPWATGLPIQTIVAARGWNATVPQHPHFQQCGQAMLTLANGAGVVCDVSYLTPDSFGYTFPLYWRFTIWGSRGVVEAGVNSAELTWYAAGESEPRGIPLPAALPGAYLASFLQEVAGVRDGLHVSSTEVLRAARVSLLLQQAADAGLRDLVVTTPAGHAPAEACPDNIDGDRTLT